MNILFISLVIIKDFEKRGIYPDLIQEFIRQGHHVTILSPIERREGRAEEIIEGEGFTNIRYRTLNNTKTNYVEKLLSIASLDPLMKRAAKRHIKRPIDLMLCATPPVTLCKTIRYIKQRYQAPCYLLLKDIFPANVSDLGIVSTKSLFYRYFRGIEQKLYRLADHIGCMSPANVAYVGRHNPSVIDKLEVCPNSISPLPYNPNPADKTALREKYGILPEARVFFYGGNLGKPQMIDFLVEVLQANCDNRKVHFFIIGDGTDFVKIANYKAKHQPENLTLLPFVPKKEYDTIIQVADIGMIFLHRNYLIPNYPNRILSYMENKLPVLLATDPNTDIGEIAVQNGYGKWCQSGELDDVNEMLDFFAEAPIEQLNKMGESGYNYLNTHYTVRHSYEIIMKHFQHKHTA